MSESDVNLLKAAQQGDATALDRLLRNHERQVYRFGLRMCGNEDDAKEVLQQTLLSAFRNLPDFRGDAALSTWLFQIARSFCIKHRRRRADEPEVFESLDSEGAGAVVAETHGPEDVSQARQVGEALQTAIAALPPNYREVLLLRDVEGLSAEQAADVLGLEIPALKSRLHRARMEMRRSLSALLEPTASASECPELLADLAAHASQDIDQATCERLESHMKQCERCTASRQELKQTLSLCRSLPGGDVPAPVRSAVRQALASLAGNGA